MRILPLAFLLSIVIVTMTAAVMEAGKPSVKDKDTVATETAEQYGPKVVFEQEDYDFGTMETNGAGRHGFVFTNIGDQPLILKQGKVSCGCCTCVCSVHLSEEGEIPPGKSATVSLEWIIKRFTGEFKQSAVILTNDPRQPEVTLGVKGRTMPVVLSVPKQLAFSQVSSGQSVSGEVNLYGYRSEPLKIAGYEISDPTIAKYFDIVLEHLSADQVKTQQDAKSGCRLRVTVKPGLPLGPFQQQITLKTNVDRAPTVEIPVKGTVGCDISIVGPGWNSRTGTLTLGTVAGSKGTRRTVIIVARGPHCKQVQLKPIEIVPDVLKVKLGKSTKINGGTMTQTPLTIQIPAGSPPTDHLGLDPGKKPGQIIIETNHPQQPHLRIPVCFAIEG